LSTRKRNWPGRRGFQLIAFLGGYLLFGVIGVLTSIACYLVALGFRSARSRRFGQAVIHHLFRFFVWYLRRTGLLKLQAEAVQALRGERKIILVANHPSLLDVVFIAAQLPNLFCIMKANIIHNVVLCGQSKLAGYVNNRSGAGLIKACQARMAEGSNLLVFPEGTRTRERLGEFKMGFAVLARSVGATTHTLLIDYDHQFLGKGWPFFRPPPFPCHCTIRLGKQFHSDDATDARAFGCKVEEYVRDELSALQPSTLVTVHD
jgi:1-acyl-sn-glycerol-3-phosphate acyltransferase